MTILARGLVGSNVIWRPHDLPAGRISLAPRKGHACQDRLAFECWHGQSARTFDQTAFEHTSEDNHCMPIELFDLTCRDERIFFSPYCWRTRMALKHKGLAFESLPWHFTEKDRIARTGEGRVPVIVDGDTWINDSWRIAEYLDETYPERPSLMPGQAAKATAKFIDGWCATSVFPTLRALCVADVYDIIADRDKAYFRKTRETMLGAKLEELSKDPVAELAAFHKSLSPMETMLTVSPFLGGDQPSYADYVLFGSLMWPYTVCKKDVLATDTRVAGWFGRLLDLNGGYARNSTARACA
jgi:glutathione S-transferase